MREYNEGKQAGKSEKKTAALNRRVDNNHGLLFCMSESIQ